GRLAGDDRLDIETGDELQIVDDPHLPRVRHRYGQGPPDAPNGKHQRFEGNVGGDQLEKLGIQLDPLKVHGRHPMLPREGDRQLLLVQHAQLDEAETHPMAAGTRVLESALELLLRDEAVAYQDVADTMGGRRNDHFAALDHVEWMSRY